jgi:hypothetical protein
MHLSPFLRGGFTAAAVLCLSASGERSTFRADEPRYPFKANTVWRGEYTLDKTDYAPESKPFPLVLFIKQRQGAEFTGVTWHPTQDNGLLLVTGRVAEKQTITFSADKVIHGDRVDALWKFMGQLDKTTLKGSGEWSGPSFNGPIRLKYSLKLAE